MLVLVCNDANTLTKSESDPNPITPHEDQQHRLGQQVDPQHGLILIKLGEFDKGLLFFVCNEQAQDKGGTIESQEKNNEKTGLPLGSLHSRFVRKIHLETEDRGIIEFPTRLCNRPKMIVDTNWLAMYKFPTVRSKLSLESRQFLIHISATIDITTKTNSM